MPWGELYLQTWNSREPLTVLAMFSPDCRFEDIRIGAEYAGHEGIRRRLSRIRKALPDLHYSYVSGFTNFDRYAIEWVMSGSLAGTPFVARGSSIGQIDGWGLIERNCDYWEPVAVTGSAEYPMQGVEGRADRIEAALAGR